MYNEVAVAEQEPLGATLLAQFAHEAEGLLCTPPALLRMHDPGQGIEYCVKVGADTQPEMREVVARVHEYGEFARWQHPLQAECELGASDSAADVQHSRRLDHLKRSSLGGRIKL